MIKLEIEDGSEPMVTVRFAARHITGLDMEDTTDRRAWGPPPESVLTVDVADGSTLSLKDVGDFELIRRLTRLAFPSSKPEPKVSGSGNVPVQYPKRMGVLTKSFAEQNDRGEAYYARQVIKVAQWVPIDGETYWGYPVLYRSRIVGVDFVPDQHPFPTSAELAYQRLWTKAVGTPGYVKAEWQAFGKLIGVTE